MSRQTTSTKGLKKPKSPRGVPPGVALSNVLRECMARLRPARGRHLDYLRSCWFGCLELAESLIAHKSSDPADEDVRRAHVFELAQDFFTKHALGFSEFIELATQLRVGRRKHERLQACF